MSRLPALIATAIASALVLALPASAPAVVAEDVANVQLVNVKRPMGQEALFAPRVRPAGDVNGDGFDDVMLAYGGTLFDIWARREFVDPAWDMRMPDTLVVFGARGATNVDVSRPGPRILRITATGRQGLGHLAEPVGDVNADGFDDVLVPTFRGPVPQELGQIPATAHVVFGKPNNATVDVASLGTRGFSVDTRLEVGAAGGWKAGDVTGDGAADIVLPPWLADFGEQDPSDWRDGVVIPGGGSLRGLGSAAVRARAVVYEGFRVTAGVGDVDGDRLADLTGAVPSYDRDPQVPWDREEQIIVAGAARGPGRPVAASAQRPVRLWVPIASGRGVARPVAVGDVNGDGRDDVGMLTESGYEDGQDELRIAYGRRGPAVVDLATPSTGLLIDGWRNSPSAFSLDPPLVVPLGDLDRDGRGDVGIGAREDQPSFLLRGRAGGGALTVTSPDPAALIPLTGRVVPPEWVQSAGDFDGDGRLDAMAPLGADWSGSALGPEFTVGIALNRLG